MSYFDLNFDSAAVLQSSVSEIQAENLSSEWKEKSEYKLIRIINAGDIWLAGLNRQVSFSKRPPR